MVEPSSSQLWAGVPATLDPERPFAAGRLLVSAINPFYLPSVDHRPYTAHWKELIFRPETLREPVDRYLPGSLIKPEQTATFGPFGAVLAAPQDAVYQGESNMAYDPSYIASGRPQRNPDPVTVLSGHNEVMIQCGDHVTITGFFVKYFDGEPVDPIGAAIAEANAERLRVPLLRLQERPPENTVTIDPYSDAIRAVHNGFEYDVLHDPRYSASELAPWRGYWRAYPMYDFEGFPDEETAASLITALRRQTDANELADTLWQRYLSDRDQRLVPHITDTAFRFERGYGHRTESIHVFRDGRAQRDRAKDRQVLKSWEKTTRLLPYHEQRMLAGLKETHCSAAEVSPDEVLAMLAQARQAAEHTGNPAAREATERAEEFYRQAVESQRGVLGAGHLTPAERTPPIAPAPGTTAQADVPPPVGARSPRRNHWWLPGGGGRRSRRPER